MRTRDCNLESLIEKFATKGAAVLARVGILLSLFTYARVGNDQTFFVSKGIASRELAALAGTILAHPIRENRNVLDIPRH